MLPFTKSETTGSMPSHTVQVTGEVAELFEREGRSIARIVLKSGFFDVSADDIGEAHLGDHVVIHLDVTIHRVTQDDLLAGSSHRDPS